MIRPKRARIIGPNARREVRKTELKFVEIAASHSSSLSPAISPSERIPALLTSTVTCPNESSSASKASSTEVVLVTSILMGIADTPHSRMRPATSSARSIPVA